MLRVPDSLLEGLHQEIAHTKAKLSAVLVAIALGATAPHALAADKPVAAEVDVAAVTTTVEAVDAAKRTVTVVGTDGKPATYRVGKAPQNLAHQGRRATR